jgi:hypothetical protein
MGNFHLIVKMDSKNSPAENEPKAIRSMGKSLGLYFLMFDGKI